MTTNKPDVVAWLHSTRQDSDVITDKVRHVWGTPLGSMGQYTVALIRLSDYEALQAEHNAVVADEYQKWLGEILAIIHRDGGHYQLEHGTAKAVADAVATIYKMLAENDVLVKGIELLLKRLEKMPHKLWVKEQLSAILAELSTTNT